MIFFKKKSSIFQRFESLNEILVAVGGELLRVPNSFPSAVQDGARRMRELENKADDITHEIIDEINKTFVTPLDREDMHLLAHRIDDVIDFIENAVSNFVVYGIVSSRDPLPAFCEITNLTIHEIVESVRSLAKGAGNHGIAEHNIKIHELESRGDELLKNALSDLFRGEQDAKEIIKWKDIFQSFERALDRAEDVANIIEGITIKNT